MTGEWIDPADRLPEMTPGYVSKPVLGTAYEFGHTPALAIVVCWQSSLPGQEPKWYLDKNFYGLEVDYAVSIIGWMPLPEPMQPGRLGI